MPVMTVTATPIPSRYLLWRLQREWEQLARSPHAIACATQWDLPLDQLGSLDDVLRHVGYGRRTRGNGDDDAMGHLVRLARTDGLAARVVLQRILPGVASIARRRAHTTAQRQVLLEELLSTAWTVIRTYPIDRRPEYVAVNLLRDVEYRGYRQARRRAPAPVCRAPHTFDDSSGDGAFATAGVTVSAAQELTDLLDLAAAAGLPDDDLAFARELASGATTAQLARQRSVTDRTIRNHRDALTRRLRDVARTAG